MDRTVKTKKRWKKIVLGIAAAVKEEQAISDSLMLMGIRPLVILPVMKAISSASLEAPPWATNSSR